MTKKTKDPESVPISNLTQEQFNRLITSDWLISLAEMVRDGHVSGFDLAWDTRYHKPVGDLVTTSFQLKGPMENELLAKAKEASKPKTSKITFEDATKEIAEHGKCKNPACMVCNNPVKA